VPTLLFLAVSDAPHLRQPTAEDFHGYQSSQHRLESTMFNLACWSHFEIARCSMRGPQRLIDT